MSFFQDLKQNIKTIASDTTTKGMNTPQTTDEVGITSVGFGGERPEDRQAIYANWFFSARLGQPRGVDTRKLRNLAQSPWAQMVLSTFKKQVYTTKWILKNKDEDDETDYSKDMQTVTDFLKNINDNNDSLDDINSELITDIGEIDAGVLNYVYSNDSYVIGEIPIYDGWGRIQSTGTGLVLKPFGQRTLTQVKSVDGSTMLKQVDIHKNLLNYWQYSFKHPRQNPTRFDRDEIQYLLLNKKSYSIYGFSPIQSVQQVIELLIQGTRYNKDLYTNNAVPDILISLPKLPDAQLKKLKRNWNANYKNKPHQVGFINWAIENFHKLVDSNRDLEWLEGQKWYFKLVFGAYGVSPTEAGFFENANKSNDDGQERVTVRNALEPYYKLFETYINNKLIKEILQNENPGFVIEYVLVDNEKKKVEFEQNMKELEVGALTVNEYRKINGKQEVEWGDEPLRKPMDESMFGMNPFNQNPQPNPKDKEDGDEDKKFKKNFEVFMSGRKS